MRRTVHRLDRHELRLAGKHGRIFFRRRHFVRHHEHVLAILAPVAGLLPELRVEKLRRPHFHIAGRIDPPADILFERLPDAPALGMPEDGALRLFLQMEEVHLAGDLAVVASFGLLHHREIGFEVGFRRPARPVDTLEHLVPAVAAPIGAGKLRQLEGLAELPRGRQMRSPAKVEPLALPVDGDVLARRNALDDLGLVVFADLLEIGDGLVAAPDFARDRLVAVDDLAHLRLDLLEVFGLEGFCAREVVIEAVLDHRPDRHLRAGEKLLHGFGHHMRAVVAQDFKPVLRLRRHHFHNGVPVDHRGQVHHLAVDLDRQRLLRERLRNALGKGQSAERTFHFAYGTVGQFQIDHVSSLNAFRACVRSFPLPACAIAHIARAPRKADPPAAPAPGRSRGSPRDDSAEFSKAPAIRLATARSARSPASYSPSRSANGGISGRSAAK